MKSTIEHRSARTARVSANNVDLAEPLPSRRTVLKGAAAAAIAAPFILRGQGAYAQNFAGKSVRLLTWSDTGGQTILEYVAKPLQAATGAQVIPDLTGSSSEMVAKIKASASNPIYDIVVLLGVSATELVNAGLLEKIDPDKIPNLKRTSPGLVADGQAVAYLQTLNGLTYNTKTFPTPPTSWEVLWDPKHVGKLWMPPASWSEAVMLMVLSQRLAGGDVEAGFKKLADLKKSVLTMTDNFTQLSELFHSNSLDLAGILNAGELPDALPNPDYNVDITVGLKEGFFIQPFYIVVPKGHPGDSEVISAFIDQALNADAQEVIAEKMSAGPVNLDTKLSPDALKHNYMATPEQIKEKGIELDQKYLATVREDWVQRYTDIFS